MSEPDANGWHLMKDAPRDGTIMMGVMGTVVALFCLVEEPDRYEERRVGWLRRRTERVKVREGGCYYRLIIPSAGGYMTMNMRPDFGWTPTHWRFLKFRPPCS